MNHKGFISYCTIIYGSPVATAREQLWWDLKGIHSYMNISMPIWERKRRQVVLLCLCLATVLSEISSTPASLLMLALQVQSLHRKGMLLKNAWRLAYPDAVLRHLPRIKSDHRPILLQLKGQAPPPLNTRPFQF